MEKDLTQSKAEGLDLENESAESVRKQARNCRKIGFVSTTEKIECTPVGWCRKRNAFLFGGGQK